MRIEEHGQLRVAVLNGPDMDIAVAYPLEEIQAILNQLFSIIIYLIPAILLVSAGGGYALARASLHPVRETVTCAKFADPKTFLVSTGEVTANLDDRRGCRTKIVTRVADARKMAEGYTGGLHRVIFYGDYLQAIERMGRLMGFRTVREC